MAPKRKSSDSGSASKPKGSHDVLTISEEVKILDTIKIKKNRIEDCRIVCLEWIFHSWSDEKQIKNFIAPSPLED